MYWAEYNYNAKGSVVAKIKPVSGQERDSLTEVEIEKVFFYSGDYKNTAWRKGQVTALVDSDMRDEKGTIRFVFEEMR